MGGKQAPAQPESGRPPGQALALAWSASTARGCMCLVCLAGSQASVPGGAPLSPAGSALPHHPQPSKVSCCLLLGRLAGVPALPSAAAGTLAGGWRTQVGARAQPARWGQRAASGQEARAQAARWGQRAASHPGSPQPGVAASISHQLANASHLLAPLAPSHSCARCHCPLLKAAVTSQQACCSCPLLSALSASVWSFLGLGLG